jgi:hypothetical protein
VFNIYIGLIPNLEKQRSWYLWISVLTTVWIKIKNQESGLVEHLAASEKRPQHCSCLQKKHCMGCLEIELGLESSQDNRIYTTITLSKEEITENLRSVLSFHERWGLWSSLSVLYTKHYTSVHINKDIAEAAKCSTKPLSWFVHVLQWILF